MCLNMRFLSQCCSISKFHRPSFVVINIFCLSKMTNTLSATHPSAWQSCRLLFLFIYFSFSSGNHGHHVPTRCRLKKIGPPPHETLEASLPSGFCATFGPHMAAVANIWSLVAGNGEQMSGGCVFLFLCPQVFHCTAETLASGPFWRGRRCVFVRKKPLNGHVIVIQKL